MDRLSFYHPQAISLSDGLSFPVFHFTEELRKLAPEVNWTIIGKPMAMLDCHVAQCYGKCTKSFSKQMERNREYFKSDWRFQPTLIEWKTLKNLVSQQLTDVETKCLHICQPIDNQEVTDNFSGFSVSQIFGSAAKSPYLPWFYSKKGVNMAAFFQSTEIARMRAIYIIEVFDEFERAAFDPATDPRIQAYLQKVLAEKAKCISIEIAEQFEACKRIAETSGLVGNQAILAASNAVRKLTGYDPLELLGQQQLVSEPQEVHLTPSAIGKLLGGLSPQKVNQLLEKIGLQESFRDAKDKKCWKPTEKGKSFAVLTDTTKKHSDGRPVQQLMWLESVISFIQRQQPEPEKLLF